VEVKVHYQIKISNRFQIAARFDDNADINRAWEAASVRQPGFIRTVCTLP